ncbi:MAG: NOB1 family endonuclease [Thermoplasmata archaeon]
MKGFVLDTSALYYGKDLPDGYELVISPGVVRELEREGMAQRLELLLATRVRVCSPSKRSLAKVESESQRTGDSTRLSGTDKEILALAMELGYQLLTDDYSIQNLATVLGVPYRGFDQRGITKVLEWESECVGCRKVFAADVKECDVCGSQTRMRRKRAPRVP